MKTKYKFFWGGYFSNWFVSDNQINIDGMSFNCGEQYMMYQKAMLFNDKETANKIMKATEPREQKKLGRQVKNFDADLWNSASYEIVKKGLKIKFTQNDFLKDYINKYKGYIMVEASPYDNIWGIGFDEKNALKNIDKWGENRLGNILTDLSLEIN
jgi:ribA/ribD-fused uncharacterized protein